MADGGEDDVCGVALAAFEVAAAEVAVSLHVSDDGLDCRATPQFALDDAEDTALLTRDKDATWIGRVVAAVALVDIGALDRAADELLSGVNDVAEGMPVIRVARQRLGVEHELAAGGAGVGGDDRGFDAELVGCAGLALADAFDLGGVEGIELPSALALLLRSDLRSTRERRIEHRLELGLASDLAADVADQPAQPGAQEAHLPMVAVELLGVGIASRHHRRLPGDADVGLPQLHAVTAGQAIEPFDRRMQQLGVGREGDGLPLHRGVDRDPLEVPGCATRRPHAPPAGSQPTAIPVCRRAACANGSGPSARAGRCAGKTLLR